MSRVFEALRRYEAETRARAAISADIPLPDSDEYSPQERMRASATVTQATPLTLQASLPRLSESPLMPGATVPVSDDSPGSAVLDLNWIESVTAQPSDPGLLVSMTNEHSLGAEKFRVLASRLWNLPVLMIHVTSSSAGEGKTLVSCNLAVTLSRQVSGQSVLLIEGDLRKPRVCRMFGLPEPQPGLANWWNDPNTSILSSLRRVDGSNLCILPAGSLPQPTVMLQSARTAELMAELRTRFNWILVDSPPLMPTADSNLWARLCDATLLVVRQGKTRRRLLQQAVDGMDNPKLAGIVINDSLDSGSPGLRVPAFWRIKEASKQLAAEELVVRE